MAKTISELRNQSIQVRDASAAGENTATRVGTVLNDIVGHIEDYENTQSSNNSSQDAKIEGVKSSLNAEIARAKTEESNLSTQIGTERTERQAAVSKEETARIQADNDEKTARQQADNAEQDARIKADNDEKTARENADITLRTMIQTEVSNRQIAVKQEEVRAMVAEKANTQAIADETARATTAEAAETARAKAAEERLQGEIDNTNTNLTTLDDKVNSNHDHLTEEVARLDTTDNEIKADLEAETARAEAAEEANAQAITEEMARAKAAEEANEQAITEEMARAKAAEEANEQAITEEMARAKAAEEANEQAIAEEKAAIMGTNRIADGAVTIEKLADNAFDDEPTAGSESLVKSGGVAKKIMPKFVRAYISKKVWVNNEKHRSFYIFCHKGDVITLSPNAERGTEYISFLSSIDTSVAPVFANGTTRGMPIDKSTDFVLNEDCYVLWVDFLNFGGGEIWTPSILELNHVSLLTEPYDQLISSLNSLALINDANKIIDERTSLPLEINKVDGYYFDNNGTWIAGESHSCLYCQLKSGDIFSATGGANYGSRIAFITSVPNTSETLVFADGTTRAINILQNNKYTRKVNVDCYVIWIKYLAIGPGQVWAPSELFINSLDIYSTNVFKSIQELEKVVSAIDEQVSELKTSYVKNLATYYQKGGSPKTFESNKKICIITAGQSNTDGRVPYADMPESIKNAQPIAECQIVRNSETAAFSSLNITGNWAFDLITYYNLVTRNNLSIYAIKWAVGGTSIDPLGESQSHWTADYEELPSLSNSLLLKFESEIRNHIASNGEDFSIRAMLWHQGEGDRSSLGTGSADRYYKNLSNMIAYIRGIVGNERLPFITGTISHNSAQYDYKIEAAQYQIASEDPYYYLIDMSGATLLDSYHFDAVSAEYFGEMAYDKLIDAGVISGTKINPIAPWET